MPFLTALDTTKYNALRGNGSPRTYKSSQFMVISSNTVVLKTTVATTPTDASYATIVFGATISGNSANVQAGMSVFAGVVNDIRYATYEGRTRGAVSGSNLPVNETSIVISSGMYLWILYDFRPFHELGRVSGGVYYKDYSQTFIELRPIIYNLQSAYAGIVSGSPAGYTVSFAALAIAATSGSTISSFAYTIPAGGTVTAGATNTANVTVRFAASADEYWVKLVVTDSGGRTQTRWIPVWAVPANLSTTVVRGFTGARIEGSIDSGWTATVDAFAGVESMMDGTLCCIFNVEYYQETAYNLFTNVEFVGRFRKENNSNASDETYSSKRKTTFEIEGIASQLARISSPEITAQDAVSPAVWDEIKTLTVWRAITYLLEHSTAHQFSSLSFDSTDNSYRAFQLEFTGQNQFEAIKDLASSIDAVFEFAPTGEMRIVRDARYQSTTARDALVTVANFTASDWVNITDLEKEYFDTVGLVEASGGSYSPTGGGISSTAVQVMLSLAPGVAQGNGDGTDNLSKQILLSDVDRATAQDELNVRAANHFVLKNNTATLSMDMRGAYHWLIPSANQWYTWAIAATDNRRGLVYTTDDRWLLKSISIEHDNARGNKTVSASFVLESNASDAGVAGYTIIIPPQNVTPPILPPLPPFFAYPYSPPLPDVYLPPNPGIADIPPVQLPKLTNGIPLDGNSVAIFSDDHVWVTKNFISTPIWIDVTPDNLLGTVRDIRKIGYGLYVLASDATTSIVYYRSNVFSVGTWAAGVALTGEYTQVIPTSTEGAVYVRGRSAGTTTYSDNLATALGAQSHVPSVGYPYGFWQNSPNFYTGSSNSGVYNASGGRTGGGRIEGQNTGFTEFGFTKTEASLIVDLGAEYTVTAASLWRKSDANGNAFGAIVGFLNGSGIEITEASDGTVGSITYAQYAWAGGVSGCRYVVLTAETNLPDYPSLDDISVTYNSGSVQTCYSTDYGVTFASPQTVAASGDGADTIKIGTTILASGASQVRKATTGGGAYSDYGSALPASFVPVALLIPRFQFGSTSSGNVSTSNPQFLIASSAVDAASNTLYKVTATGATYTDITPVVGADTFLGLGNYCIALPWFSGNRIAAIGMFGSLPRLVTSTNAGAAWTDRGVLASSACAVWFRNSDRTLKQLFMAAGQPAYSPDYGIHIYSKSYPASYVTEPIRGLQVYG